LKYLNQNKKAIVYKARAPMKNQETELLLNAYDIYSIFIHAKYTS